MKSGPGSHGIRRADHVAIAQFINKGELVLDVGCGDGQLMELLQSERGARTRGLEVEQAGVNRCVAKGLAVVQGNADADLPVYPDDAYDVAILSKTIQELARPKFVLDELSRIARRVIVSFRNYGHWRVRTTLMTTGRIPSLGQDTGWWSDGARRPCTARDMAELAAKAGLQIAAATAVNGKPVTGKSLTRLNWTAEDLVFVLERKKP
ncbi:MAG: methyltransferase domain-containing protein [Hyphomonadaceae bacterium]|nr:methyltransferase domain-containing protein [Hyphomonadaceae bacterium]MBP9233643.1 methyltransferase domain-containing protein [Hyphomonadaceae bacterium]